MKTEKNVFAFFKKIHYIYCMTLSIMVRVFTNSPGDWDSIPGQIIPKTQKNGT